MHQVLCRSLIFCSFCALCSYSITNSFFSSSIPEKQFPANISTIAHGFKLQFYDERELVDSLHSDHEVKLKDLARELTMTSTDVAKTISLCPHLLRQSLEIEILPFIDYLCKELDLGKHLLGRMIISCPAVLSSSVQKNAASVIGFLRECKVGQEQIKRIISKRPQLLALRVERNLRPSVFARTFSFTIFRWS